MRKQFNIEIKESTVYINLEYTAITNISLT